ncbi:hypothetical protein [Athalassotoga saccharophila]|uniref:Uncharacterized protein n=1 Tax=Athalassotoga saccharophila TaxID=1441386 RepID=A0A6N4TE61_9BACT|nr:hypothetical protein [Athalassotoga saccharophila]BBJ29069.1 hypothetical protein ATHSA_p10022 [Athalassotoga saccharophila]
MQSLQNEGANVEGKKWIQFKSEDQFLWAARIIFIPLSINLTERLWKYSKNALQAYYEKKGKFKSKIKEFFEEDVKDKLIKLELKTFIGTAFQIISG